MPIGNLSSIVFYRSLCMQAVMDRDDAGRCEYSMCAINPVRVGKLLSGQILQYLVEMIADSWLVPRNHQPQRARYTVCMRGTCGASTY